MDLAFEAPHRRVEKAGMQAAILVERLELFGKETRHQIDDLRGDVVHPGRQAVVDAVILDGPLLESIERLEDLRAVVGLALVSGDVDPCPADPRAVATCASASFQRFVSAARATNAGEATYSVKNARKATRARDVTREVVERAGQSSDRIAIAGDGIQEPAFALVPVPHFPGLLQVSADRPRDIGKLPDAREQRRVFQVTKDLVPVLHGVDVVNVLVEEACDEILLLLHASDGSDNLIEIQVGGMGTISRFGAGLALVAVGEEHADWKSRSGLP